METQRSKCRTRGSYMEGALEGAKWPKCRPWRCQMVAQRVPMGAQRAQRVDGTVCPFHASCPSRPSRPFMSAI